MPETRITWDEKEQVIHFLKRAEEIAPKLRNAWQKEALDFFDDRREIYREMLNWCFANGELDMALRLGVALGRYWDLRGYYDEGINYLEKALVFGDESLSNLQAQALHQAALLLKKQGQSRVAEKYLRRSVRHWEKVGDLINRINTLNDLGTLLLESGNYDRAGDIYQECLYYWEATDHQPGIAKAYNQLGVIAKQQGEYEQAKKYIEGSLNIRRKLGNLRDIAATLNNLGKVNQILHDFKEAKQCYTESLNIRRKLGEIFGISQSLCNLGSLHHETGELAVAEHLLEESLSLSRELDYRLGMAYGLLYATKVAGSQNNLDKAFELLTESLSICRELENERVSLEAIAVATTILGKIAVKRLEAVQLAAALITLKKERGVYLEPDDYLPFMATLNAIRPTIEPEIYSEAWERGKTMSKETVLAFALGSLR
jgi:tetratricopeptide (TPR) repeat protein